MDNVNDLKQTTERILQDTARNKQPINLSAVHDRPQAHQNAVNINTVGTVSGVTESNDGRPVIRINPNRNKRVIRHSVEDPSQINQVDPSEITPQKPKTKSMTMRDKAFSELDNAVRRKQNEYREFIKHAEEADAENRERVEAGLETVGEEMKYMPVDLQTPIPEDQKVHNVIEDDEPVTDYTNPDDIEDEFSDEDLDDTSDFEMPANNYSRMSHNDIYDSSDDEEEEEYDDDYDVEAHDRYEAEMNEEPEEEEESEEYTDDSNVLVNSHGIVYEDIEEDEEEPIPEENPVEEKEAEYKPEVKNFKGSAFADQVVNSADFDVDDADFEDVNVQTDEHLTDEQIKELDRQAELNLRADALKKVVKAAKKINTSNFVVSNRVASAKDAMRRIQKVERTAKWPLMHAGRPHISTGLKGPEITMLAALENMNKEQGEILNREQARIMFDHDASPYRPMTLEAWCKTIPVMDIENVYMAMYQATLEDANYIPMVCDGASCHHAYLTDNIPIKDMIKFDNDDAKKRFDEINSMELTQDAASAYESVITVINDNFAVGIKIPSIFNILYEFGTLNEEFTTKYASVVFVMQYIDFIYVIDPDTSEFIPVGWKTYHGDYAKTYKSKIATYAKIFKEFSPTDFSLMASLIQNAANSIGEGRTVYLEVPKGKCPKCGADIESRETSGRQMLFTHQQLVELATTPIEK